MHYYKYWEDRNAIYHDKEKQKEVLSKQCNTVQSKYSIGDDYQLKSFVLEYPINIENAIIAYMSEWLRYVSEMKSNQTKFKEQEIREFLINKRKSRKKNPNIENKQRENRKCCYILYRIIKGVYLFIVIHVPLHT